MIKKNNEAEKKDDKQKMSNHPVENVMTGKIDFDNLIYWVKGHEKHLMFCFPW